MLVQKYINLILHVFGKYEIIARQQRKRRSHHAKLFLLFAFIAILFGCQLSSPKCMNANYLHAKRHKKKKKWQNVRDDLSKAILGLHFCSELKELRPIAALQVENQCKSHWHAFKSGKK